MGITGITRPGPRRRILDQSASDTVALQVSRHRPKVGLIFHHFGTIATLKYMPRKAMPARPSIGVSGEKHLHAAAEIWLWSPDDEMQVIGHDGDLAARCEP
jgi:hypothetical protein